tara:strand:+ start:78 stop:278 length:201 start_codon:yes stop_codon:yes gene_type:complete
MKQKIKELENEINELKQQIINLKHDLDQLYELGVNPSRNAKAIMEIQDTISDLTDNKVWFITKVDR